MLRSTRALCTLSTLALAIALSGCAGAEETQTSPATEVTSSAPSTEETPESVSPAESATPSTEPSDEPTQEPVEKGARLSVRIAGDTVSPNAEAIKLAVGEPLILAFDSDRAGELHVHSKPEQYVNFEAGTSQQRIVIETPGVVEIEDHDTDDVLAVVEVK